MTVASPLQGYVVMIVEADPTIGTMIAAALWEVGATVRGPYDAAEAAFTALRSLKRTDTGLIVLLDGDLEERISEVMARFLTNKGVKFILRTDAHLGDDAYFGNLDINFLSKTAKTPDIISAIQHIS